MSDIVPAPRNTSPFDRIKRQDDRGEYWSARDLMDILGYDSWRRMDDAIDRARAAAQANGRSPDAEFSQVTQLVGAGNLGEQARADVRMTRMGCYLVAMNGDPRKQRVAEAQAYFAVQTRRAEVEVPAPREAERPMTELELAERYVAAVKREQALTERVEALEPPAKAWESMADSDGDFSVREAAQILNRDPGIEMGERRLFAYLVDIAWLDAGRRPYQRQLDAGRLARRARTYEHPHTGERREANAQVRVTFSGLGDLHRRLGGQRALQAPQMSLVSVVPAP